MFLIRTHLKLKQNELTKNISKEVWQARKKKLEKFQSNKYIRSIQYVYVPIRMHTRACFMCRYCALLILFYDSAIFEALYVHLANNILRVVVVFRLIYNIVLQSYKKT